MELNEIKQNSAPQETLKELYFEIYKEIQPFHNSSGNRRFSFSIPDEPPQILESTPTPPPSPTISPQRNITIEIPEELTLSDEEWDYSGNDPDLANHSEITLLKDKLLISNPDDKTIFKMPTRTSQEARRIWKKAQICSISYPLDIEKKLLDWAFTYAHLEVENNSIKSITWRTESDSVCTCTWKTFLRWMYCASVSTQ